MEGENEVKKRNSKSLTKSIKISLHSYDVLDKFRNKNKLTMKDLVDEIASFISRPDFSMAMFEDRYELHKMNMQIQENNKLVNANFSRFTDDFLSKYEKSNTNTLNLLTHVISKLLEISAQEEIKMLVEQNYKLLRALVSLEIEESDAKKVLFDTAHTINEFRKNKELKKSGEQNTEEKKTKAPETDNKEYLIIEGTVFLTPAIRLSDQSQFLSCYFYIKENNEVKEPNKHIVVLWEGDLTKKLGLTTQNTVKEYFSKIKVGDTFKVKGFQEIRKTTDGYGKETSHKIFQATEIIHFIPSR